MARNVALFGRRELQVHRMYRTGVTASVPKYADIDGDNNKEWMVDVCLGSSEGPDVVVLRDVPIAPYAKQLVTGLADPVTLERSKQGKWTVVGRSKILPGGAQTETGSVFEPTYHLVKHNYADLRARHVADLDYQLEELQATPLTPLQATPTEPLQEITATDAFGHQVIGGSSDPQLFAIDAEQEVKTRHTRVILSKLGPKGDPLAMDWGVSALQFTILDVVELVES